MKNIFMIFILSTFMNAEKMPNIIKEIIEASDVTYDEILTFGNEQLKATPAQDFNYEIMQVKEMQIDNNKTYQNELAKLKSKNDNFCDNFFNDLKKQKNIKNIETAKLLHENVNYNDSTFGYNMGVWEWIGIFQVLNGMELWIDENINYIFKPLNYTLYGFDKENIVLIQRIENRDYIPSYKNSKKIHSMVYILNRYLCNRVMAEKENDFKFMKDRKFLSKTLYRYDVADKDSNEFFYLATIDYKNKKYIMQVADNANGYAKMELIEHDRFGEKPMKCVRKFYYNSNDMRF